MKLIIDKIVIAIAIGISIVGGLAAVTGLGAIIYVAAVDWYQCYKLELLVEDQEQSAYLLNWAIKLSADHDYLDSLTEYPGSGAGRTLEDGNYSHSSIADFDWRALDLTRAHLVHSLTFVDLNEDGEIDVVRFPSGRDRIGVILNTDYRLEDFVSGDFLKKHKSINDTFYVYCD